VLRRLTRIDGADNYNYDTARGFVFSTRVFADMWKVRSETVLAAVQRRARQGRVFLCEFFFFFLPLCCSLPTRFGAAFASARCAASTAYRFEAATGRASSAHTDLTAIHSRSQHHQVVRLRLRPVFARKMALCRRTFTTYGVEPRLARRVVALVCVCNHRARP
jgi:hypothetical protein